MANRFTITESTPNNGSIDIVVSHTRVGGGKPATKTYSPSVEDHQKVIVLRDKIVGELTREENLLADQSSAPIYAALLEINDKGRLPQTDKQIGLLKRQVIQGNLDAPAHVAKAIVTALGRKEGFVNKFKKAPAVDEENWKPRVNEGTIRTFGDEDWVTSTQKPVKTFGDEDWTPSR